MSGPSYADPETYARLAGFGGDWRETWWNGDFLDLLATRFDLGQRDSLLDVGCGAGHWGRMLARRMAEGATLTGVDHEPAFLDLARAESPDAAYQVGAAEALPFDDDTFDVCTCQTVLIHVADARAVVREMLRVTRPGGLVLLVEPDNAVLGTSFASGSVPLSPRDRIALFELQVLCLAGKQALGEGDGMVGARLPALLHGGGAAGIEVFASDKAAAAVPPYDVPAQAIDVKTQLDFAGAEMWMPTGTRDDSRRHFLAGGGTKAAFESCWSVVHRWLRTFEAQVSAGEFHTARPTCMVVAGGRAP